jgi:hypothetical protein
MTTRSGFGRKADPARTKRGMEFAERGVRLASWDLIAGVAATTGAGWIDSGRDNPGQAHTINRGGVKALPPARFQSLYRHGHVFVRMRRPGDGENPVDDPAKPFDYCKDAAGARVAVPLSASAVLGLEGVPFDGWTFDEDSWTMTWNGADSDWTEVGGTGQPRRSDMQRCVAETYRLKGVPMVTPARFSQLVLADVESDMTWKDGGLPPQTELDPKLNTRIVGGVLMACLYPMNPPDLDADLRYAVAHHGDWVPLRTAAVLGTGNWGDFAWRFDGPRLLMKCVGQIGPVRWDGSGEYRRDTSPLATGMTYDDSHVPDAARTRGIFDDM